MLTGLKIRERLVAGKLTQPQKSPAAAAHPASIDARDWLIALAIVVAAVSLYLDVRHHEFVNYDDPYYVTENSHVLHGLSASGIGWAFTTFEDGNWFPLTWMSHMADVSLWGLRPGSHHLTNVGLHALAAVLLFLFFRALSLPAAASSAGASLFVHHQLRVESLAWIAERKDVLSGALTVLTLGLYVRYAKRPGRGRFAAVAVAFAFALMAKAMPVTLPIVMLILDAWPLDRRRTSSWAALVREKAPILLMSLAAAIAAMAAQTDAGATASLTYVPVPARLANAAVSYGMYLANTIWVGSRCSTRGRPDSLWQLARAVAQSLVSLREMARTPVRSLDGSGFVMLIPVTVWVTALRPGRTIRTSCHHRLCPWACGLATSRRGELPHIHFGATAAVALPSRRSSH